MLHECLRRQMVSGVRWIDTINNQWKDGVRKWLELGPRGVLTKMVAANLADVAGSEGVWSAEHIPTIEAAEALIF